MSYTKRYYEDRQCRQCHQVKPIDRDRLCFDCNRGDI